MYWFYFLLLLGALVLVATAITSRKGPRNWTAAGDGDFQQAFLSHLAKDRFWDDPTFKETMSKILVAWTERDCGGVILESAGPQTPNRRKGARTSPHGKFQMFDFYGPAHFMGMPMVEIQWSYASNRNMARRFLQGEDLEIIQCPEDVFQAIFEHVSAMCRTDGRMDMASQCKVYEGYLAPSKVKR